MIANRSVSITNQYKLFFKGNWTGRRVQNYIGAVHTVLGIVNYCMQFVPDPPTLKCGRVQAPRLYNMAARAN